MVTLAERVAELVAQRELVLPADHDRRGWYFGPEGDPSPKPASCAVPRTPYIAD